MEEVDHRQASGVRRLLWEILVVQLAAFLDRLTLRRIIAIIPLVILILAYAHRFPIPPELMLVGGARSRKRLTARNKVDNEHPVFEGAAWA